MDTQFELTHLPCNDFQRSRAFSPAVISGGGRTVWLAGQTTSVDLEGRPIPHDFEAQARACFGLIGKTLAPLGGSLENLVTMTVFIKDPRHGDAFVNLRKEVFSSGKFPASALITVAHFARPEIMIEIQAIAVLPPAAQA
jgi:enamine deaminase RidA (YjgF/YER057c/UK114 family)